MLLKPVYLFDGVPLGLSFDLAVSLTSHGSKLIVAVKTPDGKWEHEFVRQVRKTNGDAFSVDPPDKTEAGFKQMLDKGLSRYGRVNHLVYFRKAKSETEAELAEEIKGKILPGLAGLRAVYDSFLVERGEVFKSWLVVTASTIQKPSVLSNFTDGHFQVLLMPDPVKTKPFLLTDADADKSSVQWLITTMGALTSA